MLPSFFPAAAQDCGEGKKPHAFKSPSGGFSRREGSAPPGRGSCTSPRLEGGHGELGAIPGGFLAPSWVPSTAQS